MVSTIETTTVRDAAGRPFATGKRAGRNFCFIILDIFGVFVNPFVENGRFPRVRVGKKRSGLSAAASVCILFP